MLQRFLEQPDNRVVLCDSEYRTVINIQAKSSNLEVPEDLFLEAINEAERTMAIESLINKGIVSIDEDSGMARLLVPYDSFKMDFSPEAVRERGRSISSTRPMELKPIPYYAIPTDDFVRISEEEFSSIRKSVSCDIDGVSEILGKLDYPDFLRTPYWRNVAYMVKRIAGDRCRLCNSGVSLQAHHRFYPKRGHEIKNIDDCLTCLCEPCHSKFHEKNA